jgi:hypothetical protein
VAKSKPPANPFYVLVVLVGVAFAITACAYGTMAFRAIGPGGGAEHDPSSLMALVDHYGVQVLAVELGVLGAAACGAMGLDRLRSRQGEQGRQPDSELRSDAPNGRRIS